MSYLRRIAVGITSVVLCIVQFAMPVYAQTSGSNSPTGSGLNITPTRSELRIEKGKVDVVKISLNNVSGGDIIAKVFVNDFESDNESGEPRLITDPNKQLPSSIRNFLVGVGDIELKKDETRNIEIPIHVPETAASGAYYGVIRYVAISKATAQPGAGQVSLNASVGSILLVEVPGAIKEQIQLRGIKILNKNNTAGKIFTSKPNKIGVEVKNVGNTFSKPFGTVSVKNMFGKQILSYELNNSTPKSNVLPGSSRLFSHDLKDLGLFGRYTATTSVSYADGSDVLSSKTVFWIMPLWFIILLALALGALVFTVGLLYKKRFSTPKAKKKR